MRIFSVARGNRQACPVVPCAHGHARQCPHRLPRRPPTGSCEADHPRGGWPNDHRPIEAPISWATPSRSVVFPKRQGQQRRPNGGRVGRDGPRLANRDTFPATDFRCSQTGDMVVTQDKSPARAIFGTTHFSVFYFSGLSGGRYKDRTCDPYDVNVVLYR